MQRGRPNWKGESNLIPEALEATTTSSNSYEMNEQENIGEKEFNPVEISEENADTNDVQDVIIKDRDEAKTGQKRETKEIE